jgi:hypothetical protein
MVEVLVAEQDNIGLIAARHFKGIRVNHFRPLDLEGVVRNARKLEVQKFHRTPPH